MDLFGNNKMTIQEKFVYREIDNDYIKKSIKVGSYPVRHFDGLDPNKIKFFAGKTDLETKINDLLGVINKLEAQVNLLTHNQNILIGLSGKFIDREYKIATDVEKYEADQDLIEFKKNKQELEKQLQK